MKNNIDKQRTSFYLHSRSISLGNQILAKKAEFLLTLIKSCRPSRIFNLILYNEKKIKLSLLHLYYKKKIF